MSGFNSPSDGPYAKMLAMIYGDRPLMPRCGVCHRPKAFRQFPNGAKYLCCPHCEEIARMDEKDPLYYPGD